MVDARNVQIALGLFRRDESFAFQALVLLDTNHPKKKATEFAERIRWSHRIASLGSVKTTSMPEPERRTKGQRRVRKAILTALALAYGLLGLSQITGLGPIGRQPSIAYDFETDGMKTMLRLTANRDGTTTVYDLRSGTEKKVELSEFAKTGHFIPIRTELREQDKLLTFSGIVTMLTAVMMLGSVFAKDYKRYRLRRLIAASAGEA